MKVSICDDCGIPLGDDPPLHITWENEGPYEVCNVCYWHSVKNRGAKDITEDEYLELRSAQ